MARSEKNPNRSPQRIDRRTAIQWVSAAAATFPLSRGDSFAAAAPSATGYGPDPDLTKVYQPGELWPLIFSESQRTLVTVLSDIIMPADETSPAASELGVPDFVDEWISSPYQDQKPDRNSILKGLDWLEEEAKRNGVDHFVSLDAETQLKICQDLAIEAKKDRRRFPGSFFYTLRNLVAGGYYTTPEGMRDIGYRGNVAMVEWNGPPQEVLDRLELKPQE